jgi:hypothetical protein
MPRSPEQLLHLRRLHDLALVHDGHAVAALGHDPQIVGDQQHREAEVGAQPFEQLEDLRLEGDVEGGRRLVGQQEVGTGSEGDGDADPLALASRELVRIVVEAAAGVRQGNAVEQAQGLLASGAPRGPLMGLQGFNYLKADRIDRVERGHRLLEHEPDPAAAHPPQLPLGEHEEVAASVEPDPAGNPRRRGDQAEGRQRGQRLARAGLADQSDDLAAADRQRSAAHHRQPPAVLVGESHLQPLDVQERGHAGPGGGALPGCGSRSGGHGAGFS